MLSARTVAVLFPLLAGLAACGGPTAAAPAAPAPEAAGVAELERLYEERMDSARSRFIAADVAFMTGMIAHHAQAVEMARLAPTRDAGPSVQTLAARIINAQLDEISLMQQWLRERGQPVPEVLGGGQGHDHGQHHAGHMPGMLTGQQMRALESASGAEFERLFLTYMIQHHRGALVMVDELLASDGAAQDPTVFQLASDIHVDQVTEIARMQRMLAALSSRGEGR